jgi:hypothetical protein
VPAPHSLLRLTPEQQSISPLTAEQQAANLREIQKAFYHEPDLSSELLGAGLWVAYAVLAFVWFRILARRHVALWLGIIGEWVVAPIVARRRARPLSRAPEPRAPLAPEPAIAPIWTVPNRERLPGRPAAVAG